MTSAVPSHLSVRLAEPLARHTALRTGGPVEAFVVAHDESALCEAAGDLGRSSWTWRVLGAGTRTVAKDAGLSGAVVRLGTGFSCVTQESDHVRVGAAVPVPALVAWAAQRNLGGIEKLVGVPGSVGASAVLDAGWDRVAVGARALIRGRIRDTSLAEAIRARVLTEITLQLLESGPGVVARKIAVGWRKARPGAVLSGVKDVRSVVRFAPLEEVRLRDVLIPVSGPELMVNLGEGTAADVLLLHRSVIDRVERFQGIRLESEIQWV